MLSKKITILFSVLVLVIVSGCGDSSPAADTGPGGDGSGSDAAVGDGGADMESDAAICGTPGPRASARAEVMGIFDPQRRQLVFFGGDKGAPVNCNPAPDPIGETWVYDAVCPSFERIQGTEPPPRARGMAVYDSDRDRMIIFGGRFRAASSGPYTVYNDVWAFDLATRTWSELTTTGGGPTARSNPAGGYNALTQEMIVFGGNSSTSGLAFTPLDDVWALNLQTLAWREVTAGATKPAARLFHTAAVDSTNNHLYVYAGADENALFSPNAFMGDLWRMDLANGTWTQLHAGTGSGVPLPRIWSTITWDPINSRLLMFGGHDNASVGNNNDTWAFNVTTNQWQNIIAAETVNQPANGFCDFPAEFTLPNLDAPDRRSAQLAALDPTRGEWIIFGGKTDCGIVDDVWTFDLGRDSWSSQLPATTGEACVRGANPQACVAMCQ